MRIREFALVWALVISASAAATAQQPAVPNPEFVAERQAAGADLLEAERLTSAGERGPDSEPCRLMDSYFRHIVKAAAAAGARTRIADWSELTWEEQNAVAQKADAHIERNKRLRTIACTAKP